MVCFPDNAVGAFYAPKRFNEEYIINSGFVVHGMHPTWLE